MTDIVVGILRDYLVEQIKHEAQVLSEVKGKVELVQKELERINAFLKDSEGKRDNERVKVVIKQIKETAFKIEDVIDNYIVSVITYKERNIAGKLVHAIDHTKTLNSVNDEIDQLKKEIAAIYSDIQQFGIRPGEDGQTDESKAAAARTAELMNKRRIEVEEDEVVGFDKYSDEVMKLLVQGNSSREVVSIVGMAGLGKSTLARKVYRDPLISKHFDCCVWQVVSKEYSVKEILLSIWRSLESVADEEVKQNKSNINDPESGNSRTAEAEAIAMVKNELKEHLSDMRYLIVLDDVWGKDVWDDIKDAFPDDDIGSRILITSRQEKEASAICKAVSNTSTLYQLQRLNDYYGWELFYKKVFRGEECPRNLKELGVRIVKDCKGLPLSIVVIAGILRNKERSERVWEKVVGHVNWYINSEDDLVSKIVRLSYDDLPLFLKPCFLYFGIYPEDFEIPVRQLIQLWVAEGFIQETGSKTPEEVAEHYLEELIRRSLIQVERRRTDGGVKTCRIHDLLRELCVSECKENQILEVRKDVSNESQPRRLSLHCSASNYMSATASGHSITRSLFCFGKVTYKFVGGDAFLESLFKNFKLLRVLDMGNVDDFLRGYLKGLPNLFHLRYFRAVNAASSHISFADSVCNLLYLETLDLRGAGGCKLPDKIWKLKRLRHLYMAGGSGSIPNIPGRKILPNLQTLSTICLDEQTVVQLENGKLPNLKKLGFSCRTSKRSNPIELLGRLQLLSHLNTLKVIYAHRNPASVNGFPPNITKITLVGGSVFGLSELVTTLGSLSKLRYLKISGDDSDRLESFKLECVDAGCFQQLQVLKMKILKCESWKVAQGAMSSLQSLVINRCEFSTDLPSTLCLTALEEFQVLWPSKDLANKLKNLVLKDSCKLTVYPAIGEEKKD